MKKKISQNIEEYLETIYRLCQKYSYAKTSSISKNLGVAPASVTQMLIKLKRDNYVKYNPYKGAKLTNKGIKVAENIIRKHQLLEKFLYEILGIEKKFVHEYACKMEHNLPDEVERKLCQFLKFPTCCPHGRVIPACNFNFKTCVECTKSKNFNYRDLILVPLVYMQEGKRAVISFIRGNEKFVKNVMDLGLNIGDEIKIIENNPITGIIEIKTSEKTLEIERKVAANIFLNRNNKENHG